MTLYNKTQKEQANKDEKRRFYYNLLVARPPSEKEGENRQRVPYGR